MADETYAGTDPSGNGYTVERLGVVVTVRLADEEPHVTRCDNVPEARAEFAEATCDPAGPGAPRAGDLIRVFDLDRTVRVVSVETKSDERGNWWLVTDDTDDLVALSQGDYRIVARPVV